MNIKKIAMITGSVIILAIIALFATMSFVIFDIMGNTATSSEILKPAGLATGKALVVYNPGITGNSKDVASKIASALQSKGYEVMLSGVKSQAAADPSGYDVIIVGGPIYAGNASSTIKSYLESLSLSDNTKIAVFATGSAKVNMNDPKALMKEVTSLPDDSILKIKAIMKVLPEDDADKKCADFVTAILN
jgi:flavodoxin